VTSKAVAWVAVVLTATTAASGGAQSRRPQLTLTPSAPAEVAVGAPIRVSLSVAMPEAYHVQANQPKDPALIPTVLDVQAPEGITVDRVVYPEPKEFKLAGSDDVLLVYGPEFTIDVELRVGQSTATGLLDVPAVLRYQACDDRVCFAPSRANTSWQLRVQPAR
jgi:thiol:disulfide interchange protein DsbD